MVRGRQTGIEAPSNQDGKEDSQESVRREPSDQQHIERSVHCGQNRPASATRSKKKYTFETKQFYYTFWEEKCPFNTFGASMCPKLR